MLVIFAMHVIYYNRNYDTVKKSHVTLNLHILFFFCRQKEKLRNVINIKIANHNMVAK